MTDNPDNPESAADKFRGYGSEDTIPTEECPICDYTAVTDDRVGHHLFHEHYGEIEDVLGGEQ